MFLSGLLCFFLERDWYQRALSQESIHRADPQNPDVHRPWGLAELHSDFRLHRHDRLCFKHKQREPAIDGRDPPSSDDHPMHQLSDRVHLRVAI